MNLVKDFVFNEEEFEKLLEEEEEDEEKEKERDLRERKYQKTCIFLIINEKVKT